ncbi:RagB/SusD family nutrient uptake outer membrane protein [Sphingobacterium yanglingense]|uniref:SusD-like starch-binding protein associating with outer membrane n=1 Tax=Sphingobacterium yanglingense TaxID=1437280 RepID=A0A4R6WED2_9SPHI|nr:RagB/SusD family nutrient uptake outer membrane protein [Sphingobacterium yanglingense]TDQ73480.1 SusD-like starch-binding protein associating with outer membrane [Sphingobacterium yanglingense]
MKNILYYLVAIGIAGVHVSCSKQLDALPTQSKVEGNVIVDQKSAEVALNGVYLTFAEGGDDRGTPSVMWSRNHEVSPSVLGANIRYPYGSEDFEENSRITSTTYPLEDMWTSNYKLINAANGVIKQIEALGEEKIAVSRKEEIIAEARLLRAYGHYNLLRYFSQFYDTNSTYGVLLRTEFISTDNLAKSRSNVQESYESILADIDFAIENAPVANPNHYANQWIAKGMKCRVLILRGSSTDYTEILSLTNDIIENSPYELETYVRDIFSTKGISSKEIMFGIMPKPNQVIKTEAYYFRESPSYLTTDYFKSLFTNNDPRKVWMIGVNQDEEDAVLKYRGTKQEDSYALRLTEIYLLRAEAILRSNGNIDDAKAILKTILGHAGFTNVDHIEQLQTRAEVLVEVYREVARNLSFEDGQDWTTLCRLPLQTIQQIKPSILDRDRIILPIPAEEFRKNPIIGEQNPGYNKF